jgi:hypothetical protein
MSASRWADDPARYRILWTSGEEADLAVRLAESGVVRLHPALLDALRSRVGRAGRCRIWPSGGIPYDDAPTARVFASPPPDLMPLVEYLARISAGGIVLHQALLDQALRLPGMVTRLDLRPA